MTYVVASMIAAALGAAAIPGLPQRATELYTPIGESPGLSGELTLVGTIESVDETERSVRIRGADTPASAEITERTQIYLDRSKLGESNGYGDFSDLREGLRVEVLYEDREAAGEGPAEWIKIEVTRD